MNSATGPALEDDPAARRRWWDDDRLRRTRRVVGDRLRPRAEPAGAPAPTGVGFPFVRPRTRDWLFWWAMALGLVALVWLAFDVTRRYAGFNLSAWLIDGAIGLPLIFVVAVLPVAAIRSFIRAQRTRARARRNRR
ncbi:MAG: hypothetical protein ACOH2F_19535 [Cellulomonas sp.]